MIKRDLKKKADKAIAKEKEQKRIAARVAKDLAKHSKAVTSKQKAPKPTHVVPYDPENKYISKADFVLKNSHLANKQKVLKAKEAELDAEFEVKKKGEAGKKEEAEAQKADAIDTVKKPE